MLVACAVLLLAPAALRRGLEHSYSPQAYQLEAINVLLTGLEDYMSSVGVDAAIKLRLHLLRTAAGFPPDNPDAASRAFVELISSIRNLGNTLPCGVGGAMGASAGKANAIGTDGCTGGGCFFAANLHNNGEVLPNMVLQLLATLGRLGGGQDAGSCFVSVYESGSKDLTPALLDVLRRTLDLLGVPNRIVIGGSIARGRHDTSDQQRRVLWTRRGGQHGGGGIAPGGGDAQPAGDGRIAFLAALRNAALEPLYEQDPTLSGAMTRRKRPYRRVVFLNDVFFCAHYVLRLLSYDSADAACGLDFIKSRLWLLTEPERRRVMAAHLAAWLPRSATTALSRLWLPYKIWKRLYGKTPDAWPWAPLALYDVWVSRDAGGGRMLNLPPYSLQPWSAQRLAAGLPAPAYCCWNGLAVLRAEPFLRPHTPSMAAGGGDGRGRIDHNGSSTSSSAQPLRFRSHWPGECAASECSLLCDDMHDAGYHRVLIDPNVRLVYDWSTAKLLYGDGIAHGSSVAAPPPVGAVGLAWQPPAEGDAAAVARSWEGEGGWVARLEEGARAVECCGIQPGKGTADIVHGCSRRDMSRTAGWVAWRHSEPKAASGGADWQG